jgi:prepilin-type processing-associated H-X9-DG protein
MRTSSLGTAISYGVTAAITSLCVMAAWTAIAPSRDRAAETCLSNLRQMGMMSRMYTEDNDGYLVPYAVVGTSSAARYSQLLSRYSSSPAVFRCPSDHLNGGRQIFTTTPTSYGVNWYISTAAGPYGGSLLRGRRYSTLSDPGGTIWAADTAVILQSTASLPPSGWREDLAAAPKADISYFYLPQNAATGAAETAWSAPNFAGLLVRPFPRHSGRVNAAFYDGHAAAVPESQFDPNVTQWGKPGCLWDNVAG